MIGEVWEDASNKIAYSERRKYFQGGELDSVMNYPLRDAILSFLNGGTAEHFAETMECIRENYPRDVFYNLMNVIGTHDTARALTLLGVTDEEWKMDRDGRAHYQLPPDRLVTALRKLRLAAVIQFTMPGSPTIYYGDEAGRQGFEDPFNRRYTYIYWRTASCSRFTAVCARCARTAIRWRMENCISCAATARCCNMSARAIPPA